MPLPEIGGGRFAKCVLMRHQQVERAVQAIHARARADDAFGTERRLLRFEQQAGIARFIHETPLGCPAAVHCR